MLKYKIYLVSFIFLSELNTSLPYHQNDRTGIQHICYCLVQHADFRGQTNWRTDCCQFQCLLNSNLIIGHTSCIIHHNTMLISGAKLGMVLIAGFVGSWNEHMAHFITYANEMPATPHRECVLPPNLIEK